MRPFLAALALIAACTLPTRADDKAPEGDLKKLQGKWTTKAGPDQTPVYLVFDKNAVTFTVTLAGGGENSLGGTCTLEESTTPKQMNWTDMKAGDHDVPKRLAIYAFDGEDKLKIASGPDEKTRPKQFIEKPADGQGKGNVLTFTRVKEEKK